MFGTKLVQIGPKTTVKALYECLLLVFTGGFSLCPPFFCPFGKTQDLKRMWQIAKTHSVFNRIESRELRRSLGAVSCSAQFTALSCPMCFTWTVLTLTNKLKFRAGQADILTVQRALSWVEMFLQNFLKILHSSQYTMWHILTNTAVYTITFLYPVANVLAAIPTWHIGGLPGGPTNAILWANRENI